MYAKILLSIGNMKAMFPIELDISGAKDKLLSPVPKKTAQIDCSVALTSFLHFKIFAKEKPISRMPRPVGLPESLPSRFAMLVFLLSLAGPVHAQSSVTLYGQLVDGVLFATNVGGSHQVRMASSASWVNNIGLTGTEDLGNGLKAIFNLRTSFDFNTGQVYGGNNELFNSVAYVGLASEKYGTVRFGEQYDYTVDLMLYSVTISNTLFAFHPGAYDRTDGVALANMLAYESPRIAGIRVQGLYSFGSPSSPTNTGRAYSGAIDYAYGNFRAEAVTTSVNGNSITPGVSAGLASFLGQSLTENRFLQIDLKSTNIYGVGASYDFDKFTIRGVYSHVFFTDANGQNKQSIANLETSAMYRIQPDLFVNTGFTHSYTTGANWNTFNLATQYFLSKRTNLMVAMNYQRVSGAGQLASLYAIGNSSSRNQLVLFAGIRHDF